MIFAKKKKKILFKHNYLICKWEFGCMNEDILFYKGKWKREKKVSNM